MTPNPLPVPPAQPKPAKKKTLVIVALALGVPLFLCVLIGGAAALFESTAQGEPLKPGDLEALVTAGELLEASSSDAKVNVLAEKQGRRKLFDGSVEVNYEYESDTPPLYVSVTISLEKDSGDAITTYTSQSIGGAVGLSVVGEGMKTKDRADLLTWGDQSKSQLLMMEDKPVGNFFIARKGTRVFMVLLSGVYFDEPEAFSALMKPKLAAMETLKR